MMKNTPAINDNDMLLINGCTILPKEQGERFLLICSGSWLCFHIEKRVLVVDSLKYDNETFLDLMSEALARFASLIKANGISCDTSISILDLSYFDANGLLDHDYES